MDKLQILMHKEFLHFLLFAALGFAGMVVHWAKKWIRDGQKTSLYCYLFVNQPKYTAMSILTYLGAMATIIATGVVDYANQQTLAIAFTAGYMIDSVMNKDLPDDKGDK